jgi:hypothetical protein
MENTNPGYQPTPTATPLFTEAELRFYYFGFYKALKHYRISAIIGWCVVVVGCASILFGWNFGQLIGVDLILSFATVAAGVGLVSQSISSLEAYTRIVIPIPHNGEQHPLIHEVVEIMWEVDNGGWQETSSAMRKIEELRLKYDLPPLD